MRTDVGDRFGWFNPSYADMIPKIAPGRKRLHRYGCWWRFLGVLNRIWILVKSFEFRCPTPIFTDRGCFWRKRPSPISLLPNKHIKLSPTGHQSGKYHDSFTIYAANFVRFKFKMCHLHNNEENVINMNSSTTMYTNAWLGHDFSVLINFQTSEKWERLESLKRVIKYSIFQVDFYKIFSSD